MTVNLHEPQSTSTIAGVNVLGYLNAESGLGVAVRGYIRALQSLGIPLALNNFEAGLQSRTEDSTFTQFASNNPYPINLICVNADQLPALREQVGEAYFEGKYNIGNWWWELPDFPEEWWSSFAKFDEIWVGSTFVQQSLSRYAPIPVVCMPPIVVSEKAGTLTRSALGIKDDEFVFLCMFDFLSTYERKNPLGVVEAFREAFPQAFPQASPQASPPAFSQVSRARLLLKFVNANKHAERKAEIEKACEGLNVLLLDKYLSTGETQDLVSLCDCYVSMHRAEGLGLPIAEAMLQEKPIIATGWSGNMDFTNVSNSQLVSYELIANQEEAPPYKVSETWAEPSIDHAARAMKVLFDDKALCAELGKRAFHDVSARFGETAVRHALQARLAAISAFHPELKAGDKVGSAFTYQLDDLSEKRLKMIERIETAEDSSERNKGVVRRILLPFIEKAGYLNTIYAQLLRKLFIDSARAKTRMELLESKTRSMLAQSDARIRSLESEVRELKSRE